MHINTSLQENVEVIQKHINGHKDEIVSDEIKKMLNNVILFVSQFYGINELVKNRPYEYVIKTRKDIVAEISQISSKLCGLGRIMLNARSSAMAIESANKYYFTDSYSKINYIYVIMIKLSKDELMKHILNIITIRNQWLVI